MTWYYLTGKQPIGPVEETEIDELFRRGSITLGTRVWRQGLQTWRTFAEAFKQPATTCSKCRQLFSPDLVVHYGSLPVCPQCKDLFFQQIKEGLAPETAGIYAGFWMRCGAFMIDQIALFLIRLPFEIGLRVYLFWIMLPQQPESTLNSFWLTRGFWLAYGLYGILVLGLSTGYSVFFVGRYGATPGKMALRLRIVRSDFSKVTYWRALGRYFAQTLSGLSLYLGYIMAAFDSERRALHDYLCDTRVIKR
jgi:uncharacterized RDD family membrane protein YckC